MIRSSAQINDKASNDETNNEGDLDEGKDEFGYESDWRWSQTS